MTITDLAKELNIGYGNARCLMAATGFPSFRVGRQWLVHPADFQRWRERHYGCTVAARASKPKALEHKKHLNRKYPDGHRPITREDFYS